MHFSPPLFGDLFRTGFDGYGGAREAKIARDHHHGTRSLRTHAVHFFPMRNRYYQLSFYRSKAVLRRTAFGE